MVDDEIDRHQRIDLLASPPSAPMASRMVSKVDHRRHAGEVLHQHARRAKVDLLTDLPPFFNQFGEGCDIGLLDRAAVLVAQHVFQE